MSFNLDDYEPVATRLARFLEESRVGDNLPIVETEMVHYTDQRVVFRAKIGYMNPQGEKFWLATGFEEETRGEGHVNRTSHLANCETSAIGRALANYGYAGSDPSKRPSREEMAKVNRAGGAAQDAGNVQGHRPAPPRTFPNKFAKACIHCGEIVAEGEGISWKDGDKYKTSHREGDCYTEAPF